MMGVGSCLWPWHDAMLCYAYRTHSCENGSQHDLVRHTTLCYVTGRIHAEMAASITWYATQ